ncbi:hypothetical protein F5B19DRAFT_363752 [Rostrohypoxylon terebratum]|nr:hypothetical protein F5B19DRAFT_363752 [Rostrohypoxylon terebratum]
MCNYRKYIYLCNHTVLSPSPVQTCQEQKGHESGENSEACTAVETHPRNNLKVAKLCDACQKRKDTIDKQFASIKERLGVLRSVLEKGHDQCKEHLDEAGVETEKKKKPQVTPERLDEIINKLTSVEKFLKTKMDEEHAHMMMLSDYAKPEEIRSSVLEMDEHNELGESMDTGEE